MFNDYKFLIFACVLVVAAAAVSAIRSRLRKTGERKALKERLRGI
jgi:hypothetical protein